MKNAQKPDHRSLQSMLNMLKEGRFVIPDFQREFEWKPWDIRDLVRSIFLDYYIGNLLLWKGKKESFKALSSEPIEGFEGDASNPEYIVLDGQQRLTAMYYVFMAPDKNLPNRSNPFFFFIDIKKFSDEAYDEAFLYKWGKSIRSFIGNDEKQFEQNLFPLAKVGEDGFALMNWLQKYEQYWNDKLQAAEEEGKNEEIERAQQHHTDASAFSKHIQGIIMEYQISYIELDQDIEVDKVCDIFTQINSKGVRLDIFDGSSLFRVGSVPVPG